MNTAQLGSSIAKRLGDAHAARIILEEVTGEAPARLLVGSERPLSDEVVEHALALAQRRAEGEPLQHVIGHWSFRRIELVVDGRALVPRPETEGVVELALAELDRHPARGSRGLRVLDLGTGTGAIALSIAFERDDVWVLATDVSAAALELAAINRERLGDEVARRVELRHGAWFDALGGDDGPFDLVVSNPPYLSRAEWLEVDPVVRDFDPVEALVAGVEGTEAIATVLSGAPGVLGPSGSVVIEIGWLQGARAHDLAIEAGATLASLHKDLSGLNRAVVARF